MYDYSATVRLLPGGVDDWFMKGGHYSPAGNAIVARWLARDLITRDSSGRRLVGP